MIRRPLAARPGPRLDPWQWAAAAVSVLFFAVGAYGPEMGDWVASRTRPQPPPNMPSMPPPSSFPRAGMPTRQARNPKIDEYIAKFKDEYSKEFGGLTGQATAEYEADNDLNLTLTIYHKAVELTTVDQRVTLLQTAARIWGKYAPGTQVTLKDKTTGDIIGSMKADPEPKVVNPPPPPQGNH